MRSWTIKLVLTVISALLLFSLSYSSAKPKHASNHLIQSHNSTQINDTVFLAKSIDSRRMSLIKAKKLKKITYRKKYKSSNRHHHRHTICDDDGIYLKTKCCLDTDNGPETGGGPPGEPFPMARDRNFQQIIPETTGGPPNVEK